jgi:hypothetical protein
MKRKKEIIKEVVKTRQLFVYDKQNRLRVAIDGYNEIEPKISIYKQDGTPALEISCGDEKINSRKIVFFGEKHKWRLILTSTDKGAGINIFDKNEKLCGILGLPSTPSQNK